MSHAQVGWLGLFEEHNLGGKPKLTPPQCAQINAVILNKAACLNQRFWEMHLRDHCKDPVDLQVSKKSSLLVSCREVVWDLAIKSWTCLEICESSRARNFV